MSPAWRQSLIAVAAVAAVHLVSALPGLRRQARWFTPAGAGIALSYAFVHLLPELAAQQALLLEGPLRQRRWRWMEIHVYLVALLGLLLFYILEGFRASKTSRNHTAAFWVEIAVFVLYNLLIGYVIADMVLGAAPLVLVATAFAAHFLGSDLDLAREYPEPYRRFGGRLQALALLCGWGLGQSVALPMVLTAAGSAFLIGGLIMNTLRAELPNPHVGRNGGIILGAALYTILILIIQSLPWE
jgi:hypothetical protein